MATADPTGLDPTPDNPGDPNLRGLSGDFQGGSHSPFFGAGKVNAYQAVRRAESLAGSAELAASARTAG